MKGLQMIIATSYYSQPRFKAANLAARSSSMPATLWSPFSPAAPLSPGAAGKSVIVSKLTEVMSIFGLKNHAGHFRVKLSIM